MDRAKGRAVGVFEAGGREGGRGRKESDGERKRQENDDRNHSRSNDRDIMRGAMFDRHRARRSHAAARDASQSLTERSQGRPWQLLDSEPSVAAS